MDEIGDFVEVAYKVALRDYNWELGGEIMIGADHFLEAFLLSNNFAAGPYFRAKRLPVSKARTFLKREHQSSIKRRRTKELWYTVMSGCYDGLSAINHRRRSQMGELCLNLAGMVVVPKVQSSLGRWVTAHYKNRRSEALPNYLTFWSVDEPAPSRKWVQRWFPPREKPSLSANWKPSKQSLREYNEKFGRWRPFLDGAPNFLDPKRVSEREIIRQRWVRGVLVAGGWYRRRKRYWSQVRRGVFLCFGFLDLFSELLWLQNLVLLIISGDIAVDTGKAFIRDNMPRLIISPSADVLFERARAFSGEEGEGVKYSLYHIGVAFLRRFIENQTLSRDTYPDGEPFFETLEGEWTRCFKTLGHLIMNHKRVLNAEQFLREYLEMIARQKDQFDGQIKHAMVNSLETDDGPAVEFDYFLKRINRPKVEFDAFLERSDSPEKPSGIIKKLQDKGAVRPLGLLKKTRLGKYFFGEKKSLPPVFNFSDSYAPNYMGLVWCIRYGKNMTIEAMNGEGKSAYGRDFETYRILTLIGRRIKNNAMLLGEAGVGKTAVVEGLACAVVEGSCPGSFAKKVFVELDVGAIMAATEYRGDLELKFVGILSEGERYLHLVYFADEFHALCGAGGGGTSSSAGALDMTNMMKPALARGTFCLLAATTNDEFQSHVQRDQALERRFTPVQIDEPNELKTLEMLIGAAPIYEQCHVGVCVPLFVFICAVSFAGKYSAKDRNFPDKAFDLIDDSASVVEVFLGDGKGVEYYWHKKICDWFWYKVSSLDGQDFQLASRFNQGQQKGERIIDMVRSARRRIPVARKPHPLDYLREIEVPFLEDEQMSSFFVKLDGLCYRHNVSFLTQANEVDSKEHVFPRSPVQTARLATPKFMVTVAELANQIYVRTGNPVDEVVRKGEIRSDISLASFEDQIRGRIVGQDLAVEEVVAAVIRSRTGIRDRTKPIAVLFFSGPTGTGKTEIARSVAEFFFRDSESVLFLDMTEYVDAVALSKLIGAPPGYMGMDQGGILSNFVRRKPFSLVVFDELEKGHYTCFDLLLGVFDDARMSDGCGLFVDFSNTMLISTSNAGARLIQDLNRSMEDLYEADQERVYLGGAPVGHIELNAYFGDVSRALPLGSNRAQISIKQRIGDLSFMDVSDTVIDSGLWYSFRPEFLNRLDCICPFEEFGMTDLFLVAMIMFERFADRTMTFRSVVLVAERVMIDRLAKLDLDLSMGARPVRRAFTKLVEDPLTNYILAKGSYPVQPFSVYLLRSVGAGQLGFFPVANEALLRLLVGVSDDVPLDPRAVVASLKKIRDAATKRVDEELSIGLSDQPYLTRYGTVSEPWSLGGVLGGQVGIYTVPYLEEDPWRRNYLRVIISEKMTGSAFYTLTMFG
jgi:ATP-dependent Clp protease ATP-binding subunit ClpB